LIYRVYNQRYQYKKRKEGANTVLDDERIKKLEEVGFCWRAKADETWKLKERAKKYAESQASWDEKYEMLLKYKNKHGEQIFICISILTALLFVINYVFFIR